MRIRPVVAWYDLWIGCFIDRDRGRLYLSPVPCVGVVVWWRGDADAV